MTDHTTHDPASRPVIGKVPQVSIGIPVYNGAKFIREALNSLLGQTFTDFELIISDNASTDETEAICREYAAKDVRIKYVRQVANLGAVANFKYVLDVATGEYFMWAAHDDYIEPKTALSDMRSAILTGFDFAISEVKILNNQSGYVNNIMASLKNLKSTYDYAYTSIKLNSYQIYSLFKIDYLRNNYWLLDNDLPCFGEGLFVHAISTNGNMVFVPSAIKVYRRHYQNASSILKAKKLLIPFIKYSIAAQKYFICSNKLTRWQKLKIISVINYFHIKYIIYILAAIIKQQLTTLFKLCH